MATGLAAVGTITANAQTVAVGDAHNEFASQFCVQITGTFTATIAVEGTLDGTTYVALLMRPAGSDTGVTSASAAGLWRVDASGLMGVQFHCTAFTSGTATLYAKPVQG